MPLFVLKSELEPQLDLVVLDRSITIHCIHCLSLLALIFSDPPARLELHIDPFNKVQFFLGRGVFLSARLFPTPLAEQAVGKPAEQHIYFG